MVEFGNKLISLRKEKGYTQEDLANILHVSRQAVSKWERMESYPSYDILAAIAKEFNVSIDELITGEDVRAMAISSSNNVNKNKKTTFVISITLIVLLVLSLVCTTVSFSVNKNIKNLENNYIIDKPTIVCGAVFAMGTSEYDIFVDGEEFNLEKVQKSGFPYCINMIIHEDGMLPYKQLFVNGMFGERVIFADETWSGEFKLFYTKYMYMNTYLIIVDDDGKLRLDNKLSFTYLKPSPAKWTVTLSSLDSPQQNYGYNASIANDVKIQFIYKNEIDSFTVEERKKDGTIIKSTEFASNEDFATFEESIYFLEKETDFLVITEKTLKNGEEIVYDRIISKTECEDVYCYPILYTNGKGYATKCVNFAVNK